MPVVAQAALGAMPPSVTVANEGRSKRKVSRPERFNSPPPAKRMRPNPTAAAVSGPSSKSTKEGITPAPTTRGPSRGPRPRAGKKNDTDDDAEAAALPPPARKKQQRRERAPAPAPRIDSGVSAIALAALSSPSAAALLGQSPVPISAVAAAEAARMQPSMAASPDAENFPGLAMLLEASEESPFRTDFAAAAGAMNGNRGKKKKRRASAGGVGELGSPLRPIALNGNAADGDGTGRVDVGSPDMVKGWGEGARRKRTNPTGRGGAGGSSSAGDGAREADHVDEEATPPEERRTGKGGQVSADEEERKGKSNGTDASTATAEQAAAVATSRSHEMSDMEPLVHTVTTAAPHAVLRHALRWIDLLVADLKGRGAALRRSRRRLQKVKVDLDDGDGNAASQDSRGTPEAKDLSTANPAEETLLRNLDLALAAEGRGIDSLLRQTTELRAIAAGGLSGKTEHESNSGGKRGRPKAIKAASVVDSNGAAKGTSPITALLGAPSDPKLMTDYFRDAAVASAAAFISTAVKVATAEEDGDISAAAAVACPGGSVPTPHIVSGP